MAFTISHWTLFTSNMFGPAQIVALIFTIATVAAAVAMSTVTRLLPLFHEVGYHFVLALNVDWTTLPDDVG